VNINPAIKLGRKSLTVVFVIPNSEKRFNHKIFHRIEDTIVGTISFFFPISFKFLTYNKLPKNDDKNAVNIKIDNLL
jgi:hypothetical protein